MTVFRKKRSPIWAIPIEDFAKHNSRASVLRSLGMHVGAGNYRTLNRRIEDEGIDITHFDPNAERSKNNQNKGTPLEVILVKDSPFKDRSYKVKNKLLSAGIFENQCSICKLGNEWNGNHINHRLDHINGDSGDYRIENLRMVCPNCDSQLPTFSGRNARKK